ncbi:MAG: ABC transporter permease, partial [Planctomycetota bacterium]
MGRIRCLLAKEIAQIRRDRRLFGLLVMAPLFQLFVMGFAATTDIREIAVAVRDDDRTPAGRDYIRSIAASGYFKIIPPAAESGADGDLLVAGKAGLVVVIPAGFERRIIRGETASVQVLVDGADANFAVQGLNYLQKATRRYSTRFAREATGPRPAVEVESRAWYNPGLTSTRYMVPALMGVLLMVTTMIATSMSLVREREDGTLEQLIVTPLSPPEIIAGKLIPFFVIGIVEVSLALPVMTGVFRVPLRGSIPALYLLSAAFLLSTLGLGMLVSSLVRTQQQAMLAASFFVMMPWVLLSGFIFPVENMPPVIRAATTVIPLKYYIT